MAPARREESLAPSNWTDWLRKFGFVGEERVSFSSSSMICWTGCAAEAGSGEGERFAEGFAVDSWKGSWRTPGKVWPGDAMVMMCKFVGDVEVVGRCVRYMLDGVEVRYEVTFNDAYPFILI